MSQGIGRLFPRSRKLWIVVGVIVFLLAAAAVGGYLYERHRTGSIYHPHARFVPQPTPKLPARGPERFAWPFYGYTKNHTRFFPAPERVRPPFKRLWVHNEHALLEFPPVVYGNHIFQLADDAVISSINRRTGHTFWTKPIGRLSASSPAVTLNTVYATVLNSGNSSAPGRIVALNSKTGAMRWSRDLPSASESSPLVDHGRVYFGSQNGTVYALNARSGRVSWQFSAHGRISGSATIVGRVVYFAELGHHRTYGLGISTGRLLFTMNTGAFDPVISDGTNIYLTGLTGLYGLAPR